MHEKHGRNLRLIILTAILLVTATTRVAYAYTFSQGDYVSYTGSGDITVNGQTAQVHITGRLLTNSPTDFTFSYALTGLPIEPGIYAGSVEFTSLDPTTRTITIVRGPSQLPSSLLNPFWTDSTTGTISEGDATKPAYLNIETPTMIQAYGKQANAIPATGQFSGNGNGWSYNVQVTAYYSNDGADLLLGAAITATYHSDSGRIHDLQFKGTVYADSTNINQIPWWMNLYVLAGALIVTLITVALLLTRRRRPRKTKQQKLETGENSDMNIIPP
jgi:hypothetical protein